MKIALAALALLLVPLVPARAADPDPAASVTLLDGWQEADGARVVALRFRMAPGWKTYWRVPGEAGIPPEFDWTGSENIASVEFLWPAPHVFDTGGSLTLGFADGLVLPVRLRLKDAAAPARVALTLSYGLCQHVCIAAEGQVAATLPPGPAEGEEAAAIRTALAARPLTADAAGLASAACTLAPAGEAVDLSAHLAFRGPAPRPGVLVVEAASPDLWIPISSPERTADGLSATTRMEWFGSGPLALDRSTLRLTMIGPDGAVEIEGCPAPQG